MTGYALGWDDLVNIKVDYLPCADNFTDNVKQVLLIKKYFSYWVMQIMDFVIYFLKK